MLVFNANLTARYEATSDSEGRLLHSSCDYVLEGTSFPEGWWSIAVFDRNGRLIPNSADRYSYNAATAARDPDGAIRINLSREAKPYNWLPTTRGGRLILMAEIQRQTGTASLETDSTAAKPLLPAIKRLSCR